MELIKRSAIFYESHEIPTSFFADLCKNNQLLEFQIKKRIKKPNFFYQVIQFWKWIQAIIKKGREK